MHFIFAVLACRIHPKHCQPVLQDTQIHHKPASLPLPLPLPLLCPCPFPFALLGPTSQSAASYVCKNVCMYLIQIATGQPASFAPARASMWFSGDACVRCLRACPGISSIYLQLGLGHLRLRLLEDGIELGRLHDVALDLELATHEQLLRVCASRDELAKVLV